MWEGASILAEHCKSHSDVAISKIMRLTDSNNKINIFALGTQIFSAPKMKYHSYNRTFFLSKDIVKSLINIHLLDSDPDLFLYTQIHDSDLDPHT